MHSIKKAEYTNQSKRKKCKAFKTAKTYFKKRWNRWRT